MSSVVAEDGTVFLVNQGKGSNNIYLLYGNPNEANPNWQQVLIPGASTDNAPSLTFYNKKLYIGYKSVEGSTEYSGNGLNIAYNTTAGNYSSWTTTAISGQSSILGPTLVNEGNHLALYFVANNSSSEILKLASTDPTKSNSWGGIYKDGAFSGGCVAIADSSGGHQTSTTVISATRFQGKTILAYTGGSFGAGSETTDPSDGTVWVTQESSPGIWTAYETSFNDNDGVAQSLTSDATRLYLSSYNTTKNSNILGVGTSYNTWGAGTALATVSSSNNSNLSLVSTSTGIYALWPQNSTGLDTGSVPTGGLLTMAPLTITTAAPVQKSLAGYSIDGNVDVNGDGFSDMLISDPSNPTAGIDNQYVLFGGDYLDLASQVGTEANDTLIGTPLVDVIFSIGGADVVASNGGADLIYTGSGDDQISIQDNSFFRIDAGSGFDQLLLEGTANQAYNFQLNVESPQYFIATKLQDIELISSLGYGANTLSFDAAAVNASNPDRILFITPDANDTLALSSEFVRNANLDSGFAGQHWYAYAASQQGGLAPTFDTNPALIYVSLPSGAGANWLDTNITLGGQVAAASPAAVGVTLAASQPTDALNRDLFVAPNNAKRTLFGAGLSVTAYQATTTSAVARFAIQRQDTSATQVVMYSTTSIASLAEAGVDYAAACGLVVFKPGESTREVIVPLLADSLKTRKDSSLSLAVQELPYNQQQELHLLLQPSNEATTGARPVLSELKLDVDEAATTANLSFRADSNNPNHSALQLQLSSRQSSDTLTTSLSKAIAIHDFSAVSSSTGAIASGGELALDHDRRANQQVSVQLQLNFEAAGKEPIVSVLGQELAPAATLELLGTNQVRFLQEAPLSSWRTDRGAGQVSFALEAGTVRQSLLRDAEAGSSGSLTAANAFNDDPLTGWRSTEGRAVGGQAVDSPALPLAGLAWTPTARREGRPLPLLELSVSGQEVRALFEGGVSLALWQASGSAPTAVAVLPQVDVQRLAGYANDLGFYSVDDITGSVAGLNPGASGYLAQALARCRAEGLLLTAYRLPAYGQAQSYQNLAIDSHKSYGVLLLQNGSSEVMFASFAAANPGGLAQMVSLGSGAAGLGMVLGIEDIAVGLAQSDRDFNDVLLKVTGVRVPIF